MRHCNGAWHTRRVPVLFSNDPEKGARRTNRAAGRKTFRSPPPPARSPARWKDLCFMLVPNLFSEPFYLTAVSPQGDSCKPTRNKQIKQPLTFLPEHALSRCVPRCVLRSGLRRAQR